MICLFVTIHKTQGLKHLRCKYDATSSHYFSDLLHCIYSETNSWNANSMCTEVMFFPVWFINICLWGWLKSIVLKKYVYSDMKYTLNFTSYGVPNVLYGFTNQIPLTHPPLNVTFATKWMLCIRFFKIVTFLVVQTFVSRKMWKARCMKPIPCSHWTHLVDLQICTIYNWTLPYSL